MISFFEQNTASIVVILFGLVVLLTAVVALQATRISQIRRRWRELLEGARGETLERLLLEQLRERTILEERIVELEASQRQIDVRMKSALRLRGYVRYDAFGDSGGEQSFSLAMLDETGNGAVMTSLVGREGCRVYCKELHRSSTERNLTPEEQKAISIAQSLGAARG